MNLELKDLKPEQIESLKKQIAEFEKENEKPKDKIDYERGWLVRWNGVERTSFALNDVINGNFKLGLYCDTKEEAEKLLRKMQIEHRLRQWAKMCKEKVDLNDRSQEKHCLCKSAVTGKIEISSGFAFIFNDVYFTDKSILQHAIKDIGEQNLIDNYFVEV